jgi:16S rRNA G966 N2-methylase RsmD
MITIMNSYFATFPAGCYEIIARQLKAFRPDELILLRHDESSVMFNSPLSIQKFIEMRFFTNVYLLIEQPVPKGALKGEYFRLMLIKQGAPAELSDKDRRTIEKDIKDEYGLTPNTGKALNDFYVIERASGPRLMGLRLARAKFKRQKLAAGELRPELAHILCLVAGLKAKDTLLDMFAGHGSIPYEAVRGFGCKQAIAIDTQTLSGRRESPQITWYQADSSKLDSIKDRSIDRVITDPPWGKFNGASEADLKRLYKQSLHEAARVLKKDGIAVLLSGSPVLDEAIRANASFTLLKSYDILVSGKKAKIAKLQKNG